jgi:hypothetical protein
MWFSLISSDLTYVDTSPYRIANVIHIAASPERVFDVMATGEAQTEWFQDFVACRWTSGEPHGVGTTREIELKTLTVKERFLVWDRGKRLTFSVDASTVPLIHQMIEDMRFEPSESGSGTRFVWHVHYTPSLLMKPMHAAARAIFERMFRLSTEGPQEVRRSAPLERRNHHRRRAPIPIPGPHAAPALGQGRIREVEQEQAVVGRDVHALGALRVAEIVVPIRDVHRERRP